MPRGSGTEAQVAQKYRVVYRGRVAVRADRSTSSGLLGTVRCGELLGVAAVYGRWIRLAPEECQQLQVREAWVLIDGREQGFGILLEPVLTGEVTGAGGGNWVLAVGVEDEFEECIEIHWKLETANKADRREQPPLLKKAVIEMVIDHSEPGSKAPTQPPKDAWVKRVPCEEGKEQAQLVMPSGRRFLVSVLGSLPDGGEVRSSWVQAKTLSERTRGRSISTLDPVGKTRAACLACSCTGYVMTKWSASSRNKGRCRRCGCGFEDHEVGSTVRLSPEALEELTQEYLRSNPGSDCPNMPDEACWWSPQEVDLYLRTDGKFFPRRTKGEHKPPGPPEGGTRFTGKMGRVSVIVPTTDSRQPFHSSLWACFEAQTWPDKELVVVETYSSSPSKFLREKARKDQRLTYVSFQRPEGSDWSIGLKRNICAQLSTGEFVAHFDDDDLYSAVYLSTLVASLQSPSVQGVKLATWFIFDKERGVFAHCDPLECGKAEGKDETDEWIRKWLYGYGFSYVYRRQAAMENPYRDLNLGEDYEFFSSLQELKGQKSIVLLHDDSGLCLHLQHGANTSGTQHLVDRVLSREEVLDLEVADLRPSFDEYMRRFPKTRFTADKAKPVDSAKRRFRQVIVHSAHGDTETELPKGATALELLDALEDQVGALPVRTELYLTPPPGEAPETQRRHLAATVLGLDAVRAKLVEQAGSEDALDPELAKLVRKALRAVPLGERIGARTPEVWLRLPPVGHDGRSSEYVRVTTLQEKLAPKSVNRTFHVQLESGATVYDLREALQPGLPAGAVVWARKPPGEGADWRELGPWETVPDKVFISYFADQITPQMVLRYGQCLEVYHRMQEVCQEPESQALFDEMEADAEGNEKIYSALLVQFLGEKLYPAIGPYYGLPDGNDFITSFVSAIKVHMNTDWELLMHRTWLQVEQTMRNTANVKTSLMWIKAGGVWNVMGPALPASAGM